MKRISTIVLFLLCGMTYAQKKTNGTVYLEHPAIATVEAMIKAFVSGDTDKVGSYLADDFKVFNGVSINPNDKGRDKKQFLEGMKWWKDEIAYLSITTSESAYPDAIEYKKDNKDDEVWVQTWEDLKGMHKKSGVKLNMPVHRLFLVNKDNKIKTMLNYMNQSVFDELSDSNVDRANGTIYNHHEYINTVRKLINSFANKDYQTSYSFYDEKCSFHDSNEASDKNYTLAEQKENDKKLLVDYELVGIDQVGYPDYLHYEMGDARRVLSWWNYRFIRKSDKKSLTIPAFYTHSFDDKGKITREVIYYSQNLMEAK
jgi:hypothetical protein